MSSPAVTVVIPSFNHARFIERAVGSVLESSFKDLELIVVDDGSTDNTLEVLRPYRAEPRVRIRTQENRGAHAALNVGLSLARGKLLFILNSDDCYHAGRIQRVVDVFQAQPDAVLVSSWIEVVDAADNRIGIKEGPANMPPWPPPSGGPRLSELGDLELALLETNFVSTTSNVAFRRSLIDDHGIDFLPLRYTHDWDFILSACRHGRFALVPDPLVKYRVHDDNTIREGADRATGEMRFEIMWTTIRHARPTCDRAADRNGDRDDLEVRMWHSLPRFGAETLLVQLLSLRGGSTHAPPSYDALLNPDHPFRRAAVDTLSRLP